MNVYNLQSGLGRLQESWDVLQKRWQDVREQWQDANAARFEEEQLQPVAEAMKLAIPAISQLSTSMHSMQRELTDERQRQGLDF